MDRGTTPKLYFDLPFDTGILAEAFVTFAQNGRVVLDKALKDCMCSERTLMIHLSQADTLKFDCRCKAEIQLRARTMEGDALDSEIFIVNVGRILKEGEI